MFEIIYKKILGIPFKEREINHIEDFVLRKDSVYEILIKKYFYKENAYKKILLFLEKIELKTKTELSFLAYVQALNHDFENALLNIEKVIILENGENIDSFMDFGHFLRKIKKYEKLSVKLLLNIEYYMKIYKEKYSKNNKIKLIEILYE